MSSLPVLSSSQRWSPVQLLKHPWWRSLTLLILLALSVAICLLVMGTTPQGDVLTLTFMQMWMIGFLSYFVGCALVLVTKPSDGHWLWVETGIILVGAFILRAILVPLPPVSGLSRDSWRYIWDARVTLLGHSPYVLAPGNPLYLQLRNFIYTHMRFRNVPTIYLPVAQGVFALSYLLAPSNLFALKGLFVVYDMVTCGALTWLLARKGLDPRRVILYGWCPLPIIEYALQGHVDLLTIMLTFLSVLCAYSTRAWCTCADRGADWPGNAHENLSHRLAGSHPTPPGLGLIGHLRAHHVAGLPALSHPGTRARAGFFCPPISVNRAGMRELCNIWSPGTDLNSVSLWIRSYY